MSDFPNMYAQNPRVQPEGCGVRQITSANVKTIM